MRNKIVNMNDSQSGFRKGLQRWFQRVLGQGYTREDLFEILREAEKQGLLGPHAALYLRYFNRYDVDLSGTVNNGSEFEMMTINLLTTGLTVSCAASCIASIGCSSTVCCVLCIDCKLNNG